MNRTADAVIIGAGLNGAATAFFLVQQGLRNVVVIDAHLPGAGASGDDVGLLRSHYDNRPETELAAKSFPFFRNWRDLTGADCEWSQTGFFRFVEPHELDNMHRNIAFQRAFGERVEILSPDQVGALSSEFRTDDIGAVIHEPDSGTANNLLATVSLLKKACETGASFEAFTAATRLEANHGRIVGVETDRGNIAAPIVVLAAGAWCKPLAATCGVDLPLVAKAICVAEAIPPSAFRPPGSYMDPLSDSWMTPRAQNRIIISAPHALAGATIDPDRYDSDFPREAAQSGLIPVARRVPAMARAVISRWWTRPDSYAPDGKPIIGSVEGIEGLYLNTAGAGKGHKTAPAAGLALSELIAHGAARSVDLAPFALTRFKEPLRPWSDSEYRKRVIG